ncbi:MAG: FAD-binding protein [Deltaproteobacteria bacterium]|nr:FAD-binding protein [Deltaproteobacteria bacterium]
MDRVSAAYDASDHDSRPEACVWPMETGQVSKILAFAHENDMAVTPRGAGTGLAGSAVPLGGGLVLDLCRMNRILDVRIDDRLVKVEAGVVHEDLEQRLAPSGFFYPPDPASGRVCTLGGNVATNAGGLKCAKYGVTRNYVLGLEVVLADGRVMRTGSECMKSVSGYDLTGLFVGSEGTLGVITEITLRVSPRPAAVRTGLAFFNGLYDAGSAVSGIIRAGVIPSVLELLDKNAIKVLREQAGMDLPTAEAMILVETDGHTDAETRFQMNRVVNVFKKNRAVDIQAADSPKAAAELWRGRKSVGSAASKLRPNNISEDVGVPLSQVPRLLEGISGIVEKQGLPFVVFGHAGDGNIHPRIMFDRSDPDQLERVKCAAREIFELSCSLGGTITGEHGIGVAKAPFMGLEHDEVEMATMRAMKRLLDPKNILNPGKMDL